MPVVKSTESLGAQPAIIVIYGDPGICKTSLAHTCEKPILIDFDRGVKRSFGRKDVLTLDSWDEVLKEEQAGTFKEFKTVIIDTAKAALDDFLMVYVVKQDYKLATNKLKAYGEIGEKFKLFVNNRRAEGVDIVIIAHAKKDEDTKRHIPDVTGQSAQLLMRIADQVGYITMENNQRVIGFNPTDLTVGKNVAGLDKMVIPDKGDPKFRTYGADLINSVKAAIDDMNEEQREALEKSAKYQDDLSKANTPDELSDLLIVVNELPDYLKKPLRIAISNKAKENNWTPDEKTKRFTAAAGAPAEAAKETKEIKPIEGNAQAEQDAALLKAFEAATSREELLEVYKANTASIQTSPELSNAYQARRDALPGEETKAEAPKAPVKAKAPAKPKTIPLPTAPPVAQMQTVEWFAERLNKEVWMQGKDGNAEMYTGPYLIESQEYPDYMFTTLQAEGYTFRDMVPADAAVKEEAANV